MKEYRTSEDLRRVSLTVSCDCGSITVAAGDITLYMEPDTPRFSLRDGGDLRRSGQGADIRLDRTADGMHLCHQWADGRVQTEIAVQDERITVVQKAETTAEKGLYGTAFGLRIPMEYRLVIPTYHGVKLSREYPDLCWNHHEIRYGDVWSAQFVILESSHHSLLLYADDQLTQYKALTFDHDTENFYLTFETQTTAPFADKQELTTVPWHILAFEGGWQSAALFYREFAVKRFSLAANHASDPAWVKDISQLLLKAPPAEPNFFEELSKRTDPTRTIIYLDAWRAARYDHMYPNYDSAPGIKEYVTHLRELGYHVALHFNSIGADPRAWEFEAYDLKRFVMKNPITGESEKYSYAPDQAEFFYINQASEVWQDLIIEKVKQARQTIPFDVLCIDQAFLTFNDGNGLIHGMNQMQGRVTFFRRLREAFPDMALAGEYLNEITASYINFNFTHMHGLEVDENGMVFFKNDHMEQACPVSYAIFDGYAQHIDSFGPLPTLSVNAEGLHYYYLAGRMYGTIPALARNPIKEIQSEDPIIEMAFAHSRWYRERPRYLAGEWPATVRCAYRMADGTVTFAVRDENGYALIADAEGEKREISRWQIREGHYVLVAPDRKKGDD